MLRRVAAMIITLTVLLSFKSADAKPLLQTPLNYIRVCYDGTNFCNTITNDNSELVSSDTYIAQVLENEWHGQSTLESYRAGAVAVRTYVLRELGCGAWIRTATESAPFNISNMVSNLSQRYRPGDRYSVPQTVSSTHQQARNDTANIYVYRNDGAYACARHVTHTGNPSQACSSDTCGYAADRDMLPEVPEPVHQGNVVGPRSFVGMSQNGGTAWSKGNVGWTYRQILSHYYSKVKIGSTTDNNQYRWVWLNTGNTVVFNGYEGENYYAPVTNTPGTMGAGVTYQVTMRLQNTGSATWGSGQVAVVGRWYQGTTWVRDSVSNFLLTTLSPAADTNVTVNVNPPSQPGAYTLKWDLGQNGTWFSQNNWPTQNVTVQVQRTLNGALWRGNQGWVRPVLIDANGTIQWASAPAWAGPVSLSSMPGSGDMQAQNNYRVGNSLIQGFWRGNQGWTRTVPIVNDVIQWNQAPGWSGPIALGSLPGSGDMQAQGDYAVGSTLWQAFWRGNQGWVRTVPISSGVVQWSQASAWSGPVALSSLPGSGDMQAQDNYVIGTTYWQITWRSNQQYTRSVPIVNGSIQWAQASGWSLTTAQENLPGSGSVQTQANYVLP